MLLVLRNGFLFILLLTTWSCAEDFRGYSNDDLGQQQTTTTTLPDFNTRLSTELAIEGEKCFGGEVVQAEDRAYSCRLGQWLIIVDNVNRCTPEGCTEILVPPIIASLRGGLSQSSAIFYDIVPATPISDEVSGILAGVSVRFSENEDPRVQFK